MKLTRRALLATAAVAPFATAQKKPLWLFIGAYTGAETKGISVAKFDVATGGISELTLAAETPNPTFLEIHPSGKFLYSICEIGNFEGQKAGALCAWSIDRGTGKLTAINKVSTKGAGPCHVSLDRTGRMAMIANYSGGSVASYKIGADGKLSEAVSFFQHKGSGPVKGRQAGPHAHSINATPDNGYAVACDLGTDEAIVYAMTPAAGMLTEFKTAKLAAGAGPRHFAWHPKGRFGYAANELNSTVTAFVYTGSHELEEIHSVSTLPEDFKGTSYPAEVRVHPTGKWVYVSNRGEDTIAAFAIEQKTGKVARIGNVSSGGSFPRNFFIEPSGRWLLAANQKGNNILVLEIDQKTGLLRPTSTIVSTSQPVCLRTLA